MASLGNPHPAGLYLLGIVAYQAGHWRRGTDRRAPQPWAARAIAICAEFGIVKGYDDNTYGPALPFSRDQMAVCIARALAGVDDGVPNPTGDLSFPDMPLDHWAYKYIEYAVHHHIVQGYPEGDYRPAAEVTRDQMAVYIARAIVDPTGED